MFDELKNKAKEALSGHEEQIESGVDAGVDKVRDLVDERTGEKHTDQVDAGAEKLKDAFGRYLDR